MSKMSKMSKMSNQLNYHFTLIDKSTGITYDQDRASGSIDDFLADIDDGEREIDVSNIEITRTKISPNAQHTFQIKTQDYVDYLVVNAGESVIDAFELYKHDESGKHMLNQTIEEIVQIN